MSRVEDIRARLDDATPGPWRSTGYDDHPGDEGWWVDNGREGMAEYAVAVTYAGNPRGEADAALIAHAPQDIAALLAVAEEARNVLAAYDDADALADWVGPMVDLRLRAALTDLDPTTERGA